MKLISHKNINRRNFLNILQNCCLLDDVTRPSWTQYDWHAYRHKHTLRRIIKDYYVKTKGKR